MPNSEDITVSMCITGLDSCFLLFIRMSVGKCMKRNQLDYFVNNRD